MPINLSLMESLAFGLFAKFLGKYIKNHFVILNKFNFPDPIVGGFIFAFINYFIHLKTSYQIHYDLSLQMIFMQLFFISLGLSSPIFNLKKYKSIFIKFFLLACFLSFFQFIIGISLCYFLNLNPLIGIIAGPISLFGDFSFAVVFGKTIENLGIFEGKDLAIASATFGVLANSAIGIPIATFLIHKFNFKNIYKNKLENINSKNINLNISNNSLLINITIFITIIVISNLIATFIHSKFNIIFPSYILCLIIGLIIKIFFPFAINESFIFSLKNISLNLFLSMALVSLKIWDLSSLIKPLLIILTFQFIFVIIFIYFFGFFILGKNYNAILLCTGLCGLSLGSISNSISNMNEISNKYGYSTEVFLIVPLAGTFVMNIFLIPLILYFINIFS